MGQIWGPKNRRDRDHVGRFLGRRDSRNVWAVAYALVAVKLLNLFVGRAPPLYLYVTCYVHVYVYGGPIRKRTILYEAFFA